LVYSKEYREELTMKKYYVTVNGNRYEVEVEEVKGEFSPKAATATASAEPIVYAPAPVVEKVTEPVKEEPKPEIKEAPKPEISAASGETIDCPMPGTILKINVSAGSTIKKGEVMFVLEAMKMENEIMAPRDCKIVQVSVVKGTVVNTDDTLAVIE
jgi:biotin carboxyl carrier protein